MSLCIWLPMTKDLRNQGLDDVMVTNNGATYNATGGKLGGCYNFDGSDDGIRLDGDVIPALQQGDFSICFWLYSNDSGGRSIYIATTPASDWGFSIEKTTSEQLRVYWQGNPDYVASNFTIPNQEWFHIAMIIKDGNCYCYKNGEKVAERTSSDMTPAKLSRTWVYAQLGRDARTGTTVLNGKMNDFRWYDHALSPMEVKQISQGLVLHYPLDNNGFGNENLLSNDKSNWGKYSCSSGVYGSTSNRFAPYQITIPISSSTKYICHITDYLKLGQQFYVGVHQLDSNLTFLNDSGWKVVPYTFTSLSNAAYVRLTFRDALNNSTNIQTYLDNIGGKILIKFEKGDKVTPWCPNLSDALATTMGMNDGIEYDCSGFGNNGIKNNSPTYDTNTVRYTASIHLDGINQTIQLPNLLTLIPDSIFTFNIWFKRLESEPGSKKWETILGGPSGFELETCSANNVHDNKIKAYSWGGGTFQFSFDQWNMLTMVSNGSNALFYLNGELKLTGTYKALISGNYFIGSWKDTTSQNYKGYVSDARIYATALSASDIQSLYQNSAYIDSSGNIYGAIHEEV